MGFGVQGWSPAAENHCLEPKGRVTGVSLTLGFGLSGFRVQGLGFRVWGLELDFARRVLEFGIWV